MKQIGIAVAIVTYSFLTRMALTQGVPLYTADYYLINPEGYVGKSVTLAVGYLRPRDEQRDAGLRQFDARTYNQNQWGGTISVLTPAANASRLAALCGTQMQYTGAGVKMTLIHGTFSKDAKGQRLLRFRTALSRLPREIRAVLRHSVRRAAT